MNSLLGNIGNSLLGAFGGSGAVESGENGMAILMQAVGAALRGETAQDFMKNLANTHPQLRQHDLNDLQGTAQTLCQQKGLNANDLTRKLDSVIDPVIKQNYK